MYDFGYDISDYREIDPLFGTKKDFALLLKESHRRGIRVIMDLVLNHSSHLHPWFIESRSSRDNPRHDWYLWHDPVGGRVPNNWLAAFGGRAWEWDETRKQYYLHTFLKEQPDLNWRNPAVRKAVFDEVVSYWLDRGVDGFRLDVVNWFVKDEGFRSNPFGLGPTIRPYDLQQHLYDRNRTETHAIMRELRTVMNGYRDRMTVGEVYAPRPGDPALSASYLGDGEDQLHLAFDFTLIHQPFDAESFSRAVAAWYAAIPAKGWPCTVLGNHDQGRSFSRHGGDPARARVAAAMLLTLRGTPFMYYGEEIGMKNGRIGRRDMADPLGKRYWPLAAGRDPERTPMQWTDGTNAGFSTARPWLPVNDDYRRVNVAAQQRDPGSLLSFYRKMIALRRAHPALHQGSWLPVKLGQGVMAYWRVHGRDRIMVILNFTRKRRAVTPEEQAPRTVLYSTHRREGERLGIALELFPYEVLILEGGK